MFAVRRIAQAAPRVCRMAVQQRSLISGPPMVRISFPEKVAHGLVIGAGMIAIPMWVLHHLQEYRGAEEEDDE